MDPNSLASKKQPQLTEPNLPLRKQVCWLLEEMRSLFSQSKMSNDRFDDDVARWSREFQRLNVPANRIKPAYERAVEIRLQSGPLRNTFPLTIYEIVSAYYDLRNNEEEHQRIQDLIHVSCKICEEAKSQQIPCPVHKFDYKLFRTTSDSI